MNSRERMMAALEHREPDRVPIAMGGEDASIHIQAYRRLKDYLGLYGAGDEATNIILQVIEPEERIRERFGCDTLFLTPGPPSDWELKVDPQTDSLVDEFGVRWARPPGGYWYDAVEHPLKEGTVEELKRYAFPNPRDPARVEGLAEKARRLYDETDKALVGAGPWGIYELSYCLRGIEELYMDMATNLSYVEALAERVLEWHTGYYEALLDAVGPYIQVVTLSDDLGHNDGPLFSPRIFRQVYKPRLRRLIDFIKSKTEAKIYLHSCGSVYTYIPDFIEMGVDVLNPVQVSARDMDTAKLKKEFGRDLAFWGGGCDNNVLSFGTPKDVEEEVKRRVYDLAPGGGYVFCSIHNISAEVPPENIVAFYEVALKYDVYPLHP